MIPFIARQSRTIEASEYSDSADLKERTSYLIVENPSQSAEAVKLGTKRTVGGTLVADTYTIPAGVTIPLYLQVDRIYETGTGVNLVIHGLYT